MFLPKEHSIQVFLFDIEIVKILPHKRNLSLTKDFCQKYGKIFAKKILLSQLHILLSLIFSEVHHRPSTPSKIQSN